MDPSALVYFNVENITIETNSGWTKPLRGGLKLTIT
jgi:hypothetical protein